MTDAPPGRRGGANLLADETSLYLLQHADNPVHWMPWGEEALGRAIEQDRPILLSIGYSACHWCHVMAHESFEDAQTAALMNELFVNVKVDREERPDLDQVYQFAHQMLTQRAGGWPLTMFLTPDRQLPFFGGTYFPKEPREGMPAFRDILRRVRSFYDEHRSDIDDQGNSILEVFRQTDPRAQGDVALSSLPLDAARQALLSEFDAQNGGFGGAPKFPTPGNLTRLLRYWYAHSAPPEPDLQSLFMATKTLQSMALGGLCDQVGGGFFRYSVDAKWQIPHFEKMLCDNAALLALYAQAWRASGDTFYWRVANETADFLLRDLCADDGGFYSSLDADTGEGEGAYYVWTRDEFRTLLGDDYALIAKHYGVDGEANFESSWHLRIADEQAVTTDDEQDRLAAARARLFARREQRDPPRRDTKILTGWNGLTIRALAIAARHLERDDLALAAENALDFVRRKLYRDGRLLAVHAGGRSRFNGYLDDYAFVLDGVLELLQTRFRAADARFAIELADALLDQFYDPTDGGCFFTANDHEQVVHRMKPMADNATPSGNGIATRALLRLGHLLGESRYLEAAERTLKAAWEPLNHVPHGHAAMLDALEEQLRAPRIVVVRAPAGELAKWAQTTQSYAPSRQVYLVADDETPLPGLLATRESRPGGVAYVCEGQVCGLPIETPQALLNHLQTQAE